MVKVACLQPEAKSLSSYGEMAEIIQKMIEEAGQNGAELIVVPECVYPAYYLGGDEKALAKAFDLLPSFLKRIAELAKRYSAYIAIGIVEKRDNLYFNSCILFNKLGERVATVDKVNMWHFDSNQFIQGKDFTIVDTEIGKLGLIVCADGRVPEIVRTLALNGAEIIVDVANLTSSGKKMSELNNAQCAYMLSVRAVENKVWFLMADKFGLESKTILNAGRSCIINPDGEVEAEASSDKADIIYSNIEPKLAHNKTVFNYPLAKRRIDTFSLLVEPTNNIPFVQNVMNQPLIPHQHVMQSAVISQAFDSEEEFLNHASWYIQVLEDQSANLIVLPEFDVKQLDYMVVQQIIQQLSENMKSFRTTVVATFVESEDGVLRKRSYIFQKELILGKYDKTHLEDYDKGLTPGDEYPIIQTEFGNIGILHDIEGVLIEPARILTLKGVDVLIWVNHLAEKWQEKISRTRAAENRIFVMVSNSINQQGGQSSFLVDPNGAIIAATLQGENQAAAASLPLTVSRCKEVVPGTDVVLHRTPNLYSRLVQDAQKSSESNPRFSNKT